MDELARTPHQRVEDAAAWIADDYPGKWLQLVGLCERAADRGWPRIRRGDLFMLASAEGLDMTQCRRFRFDNNLWSVISRYLLMFRPSLARSIFPKEADVDCVDLEAVWREVVEPNTFFFASTWREARKSAELGDASAA